MKVKDLIKRLESYKNQNEEVAVAIWHVADIKESAKGLKRKLSNKDCVSILKGIESSHDAGFGINWDIVNDAVENYNVE